MKHFDGSLLKQTLKIRKVTQRTLSQEICISEKTITNWVRGYGEPSGSTLMNISNYLKVDPGIFMRTEYKMKQPIAPCKKSGQDCQDRKPGCHNASCTHGWVEYENQLKAYHKAYEQHNAARNLISDYGRERDRKIKKLRDQK